MARVDNRGSLIAALARQAANIAAAAVDEFARTEPPPPPPEPRAPRVQTPDDIRRAVARQTPPARVDVRAWAEAARNVAMGSAPCSLSAEELRRTMPSDEMVKRLRDTYFNPPAPPPSLPRPVPRAIFWK